MSHQLREAKRGAGAALALFLATIVGSIAIQMLPAPLTIMMASLLVLVTIPHAVPSWLRIGAK